MLTQKRLHMSKNVNMQDCRDCDTHDCLKLLLAPTSFG